MTTLDEIIEASFDEAKKEKPPLPGHPYHYKSDDSLRYIQKDAHEAMRNADAMGDAKASGKYADQMLDAGSILGYRKRTGTGPLPEPKRVTSAERDSTMHLLRNTFPTAMKGK